MQLELLYDSLFFCSRDDLERIQAVSKSTRKMVTAAASKLPLRPIHSVEVRPTKRLRDQWEPVDVIEIYLTKPEWAYVEDEVVADYEASLIGGDFEAVLRRLQHVHIEYFEFDISDTPFMQYWRTQGTDFTVKQIDFEALPDDADYGILDSMVNFLRAKTFNVETDESSWNEGGYNRKCLDLFTRESFFNNIKTCGLNVYGNGLPPTTFILGEVGYAVYEIFCFEGDAVGWSDRLIEDFRRGKCSNEKLESVCVQWDVLHGSGQSSPVPKLLDKPAVTDVPIPRADFVTCRITGEYEESQCDLYTFPIAKQQKRLDVFKWSTEREYYSGGRQTTYALVCELKNA